MPLHRRLPKRGFKNPFRKELSAVNLVDINKAIANKKLDPNKEINRDLLIKAGIIRKNSFGVKLLAKGKLDHKITIKVNKASKKALELVAKIKGNILLEAFKKKESQKDNKMKEK